ncbi:hypothetical protein [Dialister hominis]|uniref:hypothetical protein n=1 Tax=Dialister hominis TaxID=2582419 RepID=UPI003FEE52A7
MKHRMMGGLLLAFCLLPAAAGAADGGNGTFPAQREEAMQFSSAFSSEGTAQESESTLYFNDGFGRMTEFHMTSDNHVMTLTIRQNMRVMWKGSCHVDRDTFSVVRREGQGHVYFLITMGEHTYHGEITRDDRWDVREVKDSFHQEI